MKFLPAVNIMSGYYKTQENCLIEEKSPWYYKFFFPLYLIAAIAYFFWRLNLTLVWHFWFAWPLLIADTFGLITTSFYLLTTQKIFSPKWRPPSKGASVDVFIPTYNEPEEIVKATAVGALNIRGVRNVYVLDDGARVDIRRLCRRLGAEYLARKDHSFAKAGNMNFGISHSDADFFIFLDADHVPQPNFIERTLGYFQDPKLAFVQTPQVFYTLESIQHRKTRLKKFWNEQTMFYESIQPGKNRFNAAFFCGSGAILRSSAIRSVGGFATGTATEDIHTSIRLHAKGWKSLFIKEYLAYGIAPEDLVEYHNQRVRWGAGSLGLLFRSADSPLWIRGLTFLQRICYIDSVLAHFRGLFWLFYFLLPICLLFSLSYRSYLSSIPAWKYLFVSLPFAIFSYILTFLSSRRTFHPFFTEQYNVANMFAQLAALKGIISVQKKFRVSLKIKLMKENPISYPLIIILAISMVAANIYCFYFWFIFLRASWSKLLESYAAAGLFWNTINLALVLSFLVFLYRYNHASRNSRTFPVDKKIYIVSGMTTAKLKTVSLKDAEIVTECPCKRKHISFKIIGSKIGDAVIKAQIIYCKRKNRGEYWQKIIFSNFHLSSSINMMKFIFNDVIPALYHEKKVAKDKAYDRFLDLRLFRHIMPLYRLTS